MIQKYHLHDPIGDLISDDYRMLQVLSRFNIALGVGEQTVEGACRASGVDASTFLAVVNFIKGNERIHADELVGQVSVASLMEYLKQSHAYFLDFRLPSIRRKLIEAIDCSSNQIAFLVLKFYDEYAAEVSRHMEYENVHVHPYVERLLEGKLPVNGTFDELASQHHDNHDSIERKLVELKNIIIKYYPNESCSLLLNEVLMDIYMMQEDLLSHCNLEDMLFAEAVRNLEKEIKDAPDGSVGERADNVAACEGSVLSEREREIVVEIVKGHNNKEIAENMFISVNTVMTHRRNIARKLNIHSPAALTIYAIVNSIVRVEDIK